MNLATTAIMIAASCYILCCMDNLCKRDFPHALMWFAYSLANIGLLWYEWNKHYHTA